MSEQGISDKRVDGVRAVAPAYRWYVLGVLTLVYIFNLVDRSILSILQESIKADLQLSDAQLGALSGLAFALLYATLAIPIARLADRGFRKQVLAGSLAVWSLMTALCGSAQSYLTLLLYRVGVGVGEAGGVPPSVSIISDYFPPAKRATALAIYGFGPPLGIMFGVFFGGWLNDTLGWRNTLYLVGAAGVVLAPLVWLTVRELPRGYSDRVAGEPIKEVVSPPLRRVLSILLSLRSFRHLALAGTAHAFATYSLTSWNPSFYIRTHEMSATEVGMSIGLLAGIAGGIGTFVGGTTADRLAAKDLRWYMWIPAFALSISVPVSFAQYLVPDQWMAVALAGLSYFLASVYLGPFMGTAQSLVIPSMRATTQAVVLMMFNLLGLSLGPWLTGILSDVLNVDMGLGRDSLRYALCAAAVFNLWAGLHFYLGARSLPADMRRDRTAEEMA